MADLSIAAFGASCNDLFRRLCELSKTQNVDGYPTTLSIDREYERFQLWAHNIAALQDARLPSSLGYRIRRDPRAQGLVKNTLKYLEESLQMAIPIVSGEEPNEIWDSSDDDQSIDCTADIDINIPSNLTKSEDFTQSSELGELFVAIQGGVTHLFRLSMIIRKKPETDEYAKAARKVTMDPTSDIIHVKDKYPTMKEEQSWLTERLGTAITNRRQYLIFRRDHQQKMLEIHHLKTGKDGQTIWSGTKASTHNEFQEGFGGDPPIQIISTPMIREVAKTEYADSSKGKDGSSDLLRTPLLPKKPDGIRYSYGEHFECQFCWRPQEVKSKNEWKKHVFSDLRPYVCTFESCNSGIFESQHEWFSHELDSHRGQWMCKFCEDRGLKSRQELVSHISNYHSDLEMERSRDEVVNECLFPRINALECPLCEEYGKRLQSINQSEKCDVSLKQFQQHLGRHMEQLALSALPNSQDDTDKVEDDSDESDVDIDSTLGMVAGEKAALKTAKRFWLKGDNHNERSELVEAISCYEQALEIFSKIVGSEHPDAIRVTGLLGHLYLKNENNVRAMDFFKIALSQSQSVFGPNDTRTIAAMRDLGRVYLRIGRLDEAERLIRQAVDTNEENFGFQHSDTLAMFLELAKVYVEKEMLFQAREFYRKALSGYRRAMGSQHPITVETYFDLGMACLQMEDLEGAEEHLSAALQGYKSLFGARHPKTLLSFYHLELTCTKKGKLDEAQETFEEGLRGIEENVVNCRPETLISMQMIGERYLQRRSIRRSEKYLRLAFDGMNEVFGDSDPKTLLAGNILLGLYAHQGEIPVLEEMVRQGAKGEIKTKSMLLQILKADEKSNQLSPGEKKRLMELMEPKIPESIFESHPREVGMHEALAQAMPHDQQQVLQSEDHASSLPAGIIGSHTVSHPPSIAASEVNKAQGEEDELERQIQEMEEAEKEREKKEAEILTKGQNEKRGEAEKYNISTRWMNYIRKMS